MDDSKITELYVSGSEQALSETSFGRDTQYRFTAAISSHKVHCQQLSTKYRQKDFSFCRSLFYSIFHRFQKCDPVRHWRRCAGMGSRRGYAEPFLILSYRST